MTTRSVHHEEQWGLRGQWGGSGTMLSLEAFDDDQVCAS